MVYRHQSESSKEPQSETVYGSRRRDQAAAKNSQHSHGDLKQVQQTLGNQGVLRRMEAGLRINDVNDPSEREADRAAETAMTSANGNTRSPRVATSSGAAVQRKCAVCEEEKEKLQRKESSAGAPVAAPPIVHQVLASPGEPMDVGARSFMESRFGHDFGHVRVHTDAKAAASAQAVNAKAYTVGSNLVFGCGNYSPNTGEGRWMLSHELAHVIQQERGGAPPRGNPDSQSEKAAEQASAGLIRGDSSVSVAGASAAGLARLPDDAETPFLPEDIDVSKLSAEQRQQYIQTIDRRLRYLDTLGKGTPQPESGIVIPGLGAESPEAERARLFDWRKKLEAGSGILVASGIVRSTARPTLTSRGLPATIPAADTKAATQQTRSTAQAHTAPPAYLAPKPQPRTLEDVLAAANQDPHQKQGVEGFKHLEALPFSPDVAQSWLGGTQGEQSKSGATTTRSGSQAHTSPPGYLAPKPQPRTLEDTLAAANADPHRKQGGEATKHLEMPPLSPQQLEEFKAAFYRKPGEVTLPDGQKVVIPPKPPNEITEDWKFGESTLATANVQGVRADVVRSLNAELKAIEEGSGVNREVLANLRKAHEAIRNGDLESAVELTKLARSARRVGVATMSDSDRLAEAVKRAVPKLPGETGERLKELLTPEAIGAMVAFTGVYIVSQLTPAGWIADVIAAGLLITTLYMGGSEIAAILENLGDFATIASSAKTESDLDVAADHLAIAVTKIGVDVILAILLHKAGAAAKPYVKPSPFSGAVADMVTRDGKTVRVPADSVPESKLATAEQGKGGPPLDVYDVEAWKKYYEQNPNAKRSVGSAQTDDPYVFTEEGTNIPPDSSQVRVEGRTRGGAIERDHLDRMPQYSRPREHDFPGIDGWKGGREMTRGETRIVYGADVLQIKSIGSDSPSTIRARVREGVAGLEPDRFEKGTTRVVNPRSRRLDVVFEEGTLRDVNSAIKALLLELTENAGHSGVEVRWFRYVSGRQISIPVP